MMKTSKTIRKLQLKGENIRALSPGALEAAAGGMPARSDTGSCADTIIDTACAFCLTEAGC